jgi:GNAT superfamily N-acetyltransferase
LRLSSDEKEEDLNLSAKDWWQKAEEYIHSDSMLRIGFFILVQDNKNLIGFNLFTQVNEKKECAYLFVQRDYRRHGIASEMLKQSGIRYALALQEANPFWQIWAERNNCTFPPGSLFMQPVAD